MLFVADMNEIKREQKRTLFEELEKITHCTHWFHFVKIFRNDEIHKTKLLIEK
jgi:hypothetical protein